MEKGLNSTEAARKLIEFGFNELSTSQRKGVLRIAFEVIKEPMFILLLACGTLYLLLGDFKEGIIMLSSIFIIITITFFQHRKTEQALEALKKLSSPRALVIRDGTEKRIPGREVVPGDIVLLHEGDRIPADGKLIESMNLLVDESILTGESLPVLKNILKNEAQVFSGTLVIKGNGIYLVESTGKNTEFGKIGKSLEKINSETTPLQTEFSKLIRTLGIIGIILCISVILLFYFTRGNFLHSLLNGLAAAMAILPEEFPVVLTVFLALGAWRLSKKNVLTRKPSAIETLGSATILCSDKTGTITQNKMIIASVYNDGAIIQKEDFNKLDEKQQTVIRHAYYASTPRSSDPMEKAIISANEALTKSDENFEFLKEYSFSHELMAMTRIYKNPVTNEMYAIAKGAPETLFELCRLDTSEKNNVLQAVHDIASSGKRVIAIASTLLKNDQLPESQKEFQFTLDGLIGLEDPIRPEVPQAIQECRSAGIKVMMITGDFPETAKNIGKQIGLEEQEILTGEELEKLSDNELAVKIASISILARVKPEQKLRIVEALKRNKEIVAMTGDGVNDAPALKAAHIGISMGNKGTDVAREASSLVLIDDNFASIVSAIRMGRTIFDNLQKAMSYILSIHIPIIGLTLLPAFFSSYPILLMPLHIILLELIIDPVSSIAFESEGEEKGIMDRHPRNPLEPFFGTKIILRSVAHGILLLVMVLIVFYITKQEGHSDEASRTISFTALVLGNLFMAMSKLSSTKSFASELISRNWQAKIIFILALILYSCILFIPSLSSLFNLKFPGFKEIGIAFIAAFVLLSILEIIKFVRLKTSRKT